MDTLSLYCSKETVAGYVATPQESLTGTRYSEAHIAISQRQTDYGFSFVMIAAT